MILFDYVINSADLKLNNSKKNISGIKSGNIIISTPEIKYHQNIKENSIKIYISSLI